MTKIIITALIVLLLIAGVVIFLDNVKVQQATPSPSPTDVVTPTATPTELSTEGNIKVTSPVAGDEVGLPLVIKGEARVFEGTFAYRVLNEDGSVLMERSAMTTGGADIGAFDPFSISSNYPEPKSSKGSIVVFDYSEKDGSEINKVTIPVTFATVQTQKVKIYFSNDKIDPQLTVCSKVKYVERRIPKTQTPIRSSLEELMTGTTKAEASEGYKTNINTGVKVNSASLEGGILKVDFSKELNAGVAGACRVEAIKAQIESTAKQFGNVQTVIISVDGKTEGILQP